MLKLEKKKQQKQQQHQREEQQEQTDWAKIPNTKGGGPRIKMMNK